MGLGRRASARCRRCRGSFRRGSWSPIARATVGPPTRSRSARWERGSRSPTYARTRTKVTGMHARPAPPSSPIATSSRCSTPRCATAPRSALRVRAVRSPPVRRPPRRRRRRHRTAPSGLLRDFRFHDDELRFLPRWAGGGCRDAHSSPATASREPSADAPRGRAVLPGLSILTVEGTFRRPWSWRPSRSACSTTTPRSRRPRRSSTSRGRRPAARRSNSRRAAEVSAVAAAAPPRTSWVRRPAT